MSPEGQDPAATQALQAVTRHQNEAPDPCRCLLLCPRDTLETRVQSARLSADGFFSRPIDLRALIETLDLLLELHHPTPYRAMVVERSRAWRSGCRLPPETPTTAAACGVEWRGWPGGARPPGRRRGASW